MVEALILKAQRRDATGTRASRAERKEGLVPAIVYGHKQEPVAIRLSYHDLMLELQHHHRLVKVEIDGRMEQLLVKDVQYDHLGDKIVHVDLTRVDLDERVTVTVAVELRGFASGGEHGILDQVNAEVELECLVTNIPEILRISAAELQVGDTLTAGQLELPGDTKLVSAPEMVLAAVHALVTAEAAEEAEAVEPGEEEPEVITERAKPEEEGEKKKS